MILTMATHTGELNCHYNHIAELVYHLDHSTHEVEAHPITSKLQNTVENYFEINPKLTV